MGDGDEDVVEPFDEGRGQGAGEPGGAPSDRGDGPGRPSEIGVAAALQVAIGIYALVVAAILVAFPTILPMPAQGSAETVRTILAAIGGFLVVIAILNLVAAWGVHDGRGWARILAIVLAILALLSFPIGTLLGALVLYFLTRDPVEAYFRREGAPT